MKSKTINAIITKKMKDWFASIEDETVRKLVEKNTIVTGGCIASMLLNEKVNDFDIYFKNRVTALAVAKYYISRFNPTNARGISRRIYIDENHMDRVKIVIKSSGIAAEDEQKAEYEYFERDNQATPDAGQYVSTLMSDSGEIEDTYDDVNEQAQEIEDDGPKYRPVFLSTNAITLSHRVQLITRFFGEPSEIHENYDFVHCTNYWMDGKLYLNQPALEALLAKELKYVGSKYPLCSIMRLRKFIKRGWHINAGQILKAAMQLNALDLTDPAVLEAQLTGVDSSYFTEIIQKVKDKDPEKINSAYLIEIVDRIF